MNDNRSRSEGEGEGECEGGGGGPALPRDLRLRGRGAASNRSGRFETERRSPFDDGWAGDAEAPRLLRTEVREERARSAIVWQTSPDLPFDRSINPYRGCEHGCAYCYARPTHAWLGLSAGLDFETRLVARPGLGAVLERELRARGYRPAPLAIGTNTDPYQPLEARHRIMREVLGVLSAFRHPVAITTRGVLVERDIDLLGEMGRAGLAQVMVSITTLDAGLARAMEPPAPTPARRLEMLGRLSAAGVPVGVMVAPLIPGLTDHEAEAIVAAAAGAGARAAVWITLRLPGEVEGLFDEWLAAHVPDRREKVLGRLRELHGGRLYDPSFGRRFRGGGVWADLMAQRFRRARKAHGMAAELEPLRSDLFRPPPCPGDQLSLFD